MAEIRLCTAYRNDYQHDVCGLKSCLSSNGGYLSASRQRHSEGRIHTPFGIRSQGRPVYDIGHRRVRAHSVVQLASAGVTAICTQNMHTNKTLYHHND